eukprot:TRINITY_DN72186_c0_g1_i1.p1 TRINITY_DN72186_c0_g1~~TRINITY_DN72186_c0_g1_i1.p1  ORF type:complete len:173 (+),score=9.06 TRINITY_DN72186_c0_g1_i1:76-594(+)
MTAKLLQKFPTEQILGVSQGNTPDTLIITLAEQGIHFYQLSTGNCVNRFAQNILLYSRCIFSPYDQKYFVVSQAKQLVSFDDDDVEKGVNFSQLSTSYTLKFDSVSDLYPLQQTGVWIVGQEAHIAIGTLKQNGNFTINYCEKDTEFEKIITSHINEEGTLKVFGKMKSKFL